MRSYIASARMQQYFRPTETNPGYDVVTENRYFVGEDGIEWEELSFAVNDRNSGESGRRSRCCSRKGADAPAAAPLRRGISRTGS